MRTLFRANKTVLAMTILVVVPVAVGQQDKPRVYISGTGNIDVRTDASAFGGRLWAVGSSHSTVGAHNQTMELAKDFGKQCSDVTVSLNGVDADYMVDMNHEAFHGLAHKNNQIMVTNRRRDVVFTNTTRAVSHSVNDSCMAILADWKANGRIEVPVTAAPVPIAAAVVRASETNSVVNPPQPTMQVMSVDQQESLGDAARRIRAKKAAAATQQQSSVPAPPNQ